MERTVLKFEGNGSFSVKYSNKGFYTVSIDGKEEIYHEKLRNYVKELFVGLVDEKIKYVFKVVDGHEQKIVTVSEFSDTKKDVKVHPGDIYEEYVLENDEIVVQTDKVDVKNIKDILVHWVTTFFDEIYK